MTALLGQYEMAVDDLLERRLPAPITLNEGRKSYLIARSGAAVLRVVRYMDRDTLTRNCYVTPTPQAMTEVNYSSHIKVDDENPPTGQLVRLLQAATPIPLDDVWGVVRAEKVVELMNFSASAAAPVTNHGNHQNPELYDSCIAGRVPHSPYMVLKDGHAGLKNFWRLAGQREIVPVRTLLRKTNFFFGTPDGKCGVFVIDGVFLMHPEMWRKWPAPTRAGLKNVTNLHYMVSGGPGSTWRNGGDIPML